MQAVPEVTLSVADASPQRLGLRSRDSRMMDGAGVADDLASLTTAVVAGDEDRVQQLLSRTPPRFYCHHTLGVQGD